MMKRLVGQLKKSKSAYPGHIYYYTIKEKTRYAYEVRTSANRFFAMPEYIKTIAEVLRLPGVSSSYRIYDTTKRVGRKGNYKFSVHKYHGKKSGERAPRVKVSIF